jgi:hypothetical protein
MAFARPFDRICQTQLLCSLLFPFPQRDISRRRTATVKDIHDTSVIYRQSSISCRNAPVSRRQAVVRNIAYCLPFALLHIINGSDRCRRGPQRPMRGETLHQGASNRWGPVAAYGRSEMSRLLLRDNRRTRHCCPKPLTAVPPGRIAGKTCTWGATRDRRRCPSSATRRR